MKDDLFGSNSYLHYSNVNDDSPGYLSNGGSHNWKSIYKRKKLTKRDILWIILAIIAIIIEIKY